MEAHYDVLAAMLAINSKAQVTIREENIDTIEWNHGPAQISKYDITAKQAESKTAYDNKAYARKRAKENQFSLREQIEEILRRSAVNRKNKKKTIKVDDKLVAAFSRDKRGRKTK